MTMHVDVELYRDRSRVGNLRLDDGERFRCLGKSDDSAAKANGNPSRDPLKPFGDLPVGDYLACRSVPKNATPEDVRSYGEGPVWVLNPKSGQALDSMLNGRHGILIHAGDTGAPLPAGSLRPTHGCLRVDGNTIAALDQRFGSTPFTVTVSEVTA